MKCLVPQVSKVVIHYTPSFFEFGMALLVTGCIYFILLGGPVKEFQWIAFGAILMLVTLVCVWWSYCRLTITASEFSILSSGWRKRTYRSCLEDVSIDNKPPLRPVVSEEKYPRAVAAIELDNDFDTNEEYIYIEFNGHSIEHSFSVRQYAVILAACRTMIAQHQELINKRVAAETIE